MACVFDISSDRAMFRKPYTTTSSVSYPFPPPSTVAGILSAILGYKNGSNRKGYYSKFWEKMKDTQIAIKINKNIRWETRALNFWNTKDAKNNPRVQIKHQFVKKPGYRIFVKGQIEEPLAGSLENRQYHFTPYLGVAYAIADIEYLGRSTEEQPAEMAVDSVLSTTEEETEIEFSKTKTLNRTVMPFQLDGERGLVSSMIIAYKMEKGKIYLNKPQTNIKKVGEDIVAWLPKWR